MLPSSNLSQNSSTFSFSIHSTPYHNPFNQTFNYTHNISNINETYTFIKNLTPITDDFYDHVSPSPLPSSSSSSSSTSARASRNKKKSRNAEKQLETTDSHFFNPQDEDIASFTYNPLYTTTNNTSTQQKIIPSTNLQLNKDNINKVAVNADSKTTGTDLDMHTSIPGGQNIKAQKKGRKTRTLKKSCKNFTSLWNIFVVGTVNFFGLVANTLSIMVLNRDKNNRVPTFLLQTLATFDNIVLVVSFFVLFYANGIMLWNDYDVLRDFSPYIIKYLNPVGLVGQTCVIWSTVLLAINRFIAVCRPFSAKRNLTMFRARMQVAFLVVAVVLLCIPFFMRKQIFKPPKNTTSLPLCKPFYFSNLSQPIFLKEEEEEGVGGGGGDWILNRSLVEAFNNTYGSHGVVFENIIYKYNCTPSNNLTNPCIHKRLSTRLIQSSVKIGSLLMHERFHLDEKSYREQGLNISLNPFKLDLFNYTSENCTNDTDEFPFVKPSGLGSNPYFVLYYYQILFNFLTVGLPITLLIALNIPIIYAMRTSKRLMQQTSQIYRGTQEKNITIVMIIIILELLFCHIPDRILVVYLNSFPGDYSCPHPIFFLQFIFNLLILINSSSDFIIYYIFRTRFRNILKNELCSKVTRRFSSLPYQRGSDVHLSSTRKPILQPIVAPKPTRK